MMDASEKTDVADGASFPIGMKVLVVDHCCVPSRVLSHMLKSCGYQVTECEEHNKALKLLRESKFDLVISNMSHVLESDMDGLKLLELIGLEMDLPLIIVSTDSRKEIIMKAIQHGACDYLIKPLQKKDVEFIWKHVVRRKNMLPDPESSESLEKKNNESLPRKNNETISDAVRSRKKNREPNGEDEDEMENGEISRKKGRFNWNGERHKQFVAAVNQLGVNNAVPKKILSVLNIPGLKREHVASHLQKYRLGIKKAEKEKQGQQLQHINSPFGVSLNPIMGPTGLFSFQTLPQRPVNWNNHAPDMIPHLHNTHQIASSTNAPGLLADSHDMLWQVVASQQLPARQTSMNQLLTDQTYSLRNMQHGSNDTSLSDNLMGVGTGTLVSNNGVLNNNSYNRSLSNGFMQNSHSKFSKALVGTERIESPCSNLTCGNSESILDPNSWDLDNQM